MDFGHIGSRDFVALRSLALINIETIKRTAPCYMSYSLPFLHFTIGRPIYKVYHKKGFEQKYPLLSGFTFEVVQITPANALYSIDLHV